MKKALQMFLKLMVFVGIVSCATNVFATVTVLETGGDYAFRWQTQYGDTDVYKIKNMDGGSWVNESVWEIDVTNPDGIILSSWEAWDGFVVGDEFNPIVDGVQIEWDTTFYVDNYFHGKTENMFLSFGSHTFGLEVYELAQGYCSGSGFSSFGETSDPVPEPATMLLFGAGLTCFIGVARRKNKDLKA